MGRYRSPTPKGSPYITPAGYATLESELDGLWRRRAEVTRALTAAAAEGDRSENAEYIYRKKQLREIDRRIHYLQKRLPELTVVKSQPADHDRVFFAAWVLLEDETGTAHVHRIVGPDEISLGPHHISLDAPVARSLLKKAVGDEVTVITPTGKRQYNIVAVSYDEKPGFLEN